MNLIEAAALIRANINDIKYEYEYLTGDTLPYKAVRLKKLRSALRNVEVIPYIADEIAKLKSTWLFNTDEDEIKCDYNKHNAVEPTVTRIRTGLQFLIKVQESSDHSNSEEVIYIKLPELHSFEELAKTANDLKRAIELPIHLDDIGGNVDILSAESGSIWLIVSLETFAAVQLIGSICWSAAVIRKKNAEAKIVEQHLKTLELKNESLESVISAQKAQLNNITNNEAEAISNKHYNRNEPENIERLKLSISTIADLIEKGTQILPATKDADTIKQFPDYNTINLIESSIKQIMDQNIK